MYKYVYANDMLIYRERRISWNFDKYDDANIIQFRLIFLPIFLNVCRRECGMWNIRNDVGMKFLREDVQSFFDTLRFEVEFFPSLLPHFLYGGGDHTFGKIYLISLPRDFAKIFYNPCDSWSLINDKNLIPRGSFRQQCRRGSSIRLSDATLKDNAWNSPQRKFLNVD